MATGIKQLAHGLRINGPLEVKGGITSQELVPAFEDLAAGDFVDLFDDSGTRKARLAIADDKDNPKKADAYVEVAVTAGNTATVQAGGTNVNVSGLTLGGDVFLSDTVPGGVSPTAPVAPTSFAQPLGTGISATSMSVDIDGGVGAGGDEDRLPLDNKRTTPLDTDHRILTFAEQIVAVQKQKEGLVFIDKRTGLQTRFLPGINWLPPIDLGGLALAFGSDNQLYVHSGSAGTTELARIDIATGEWTTVVAQVAPPAPLGDFGTVGMEFHPDGTLYQVGYDGGLDNFHLVKFNISTGVTTNVAIIVLDISAGAADDVDGIAINSDGTQAFVLIGDVGGPAAEAYLYSLNLSTGAATQIGNTGFDRGSNLSFDADDILHAVMRDRATANVELVTIDTGTGVATSVGRTFIEDQFPGQPGGGAYAHPGMAIRRRSSAASEFSPTQHGSGQDGHEYGVADAAKITVHPAPSAFVDGMTVSAVMGFANTGAMTLKVNEAAADAVILKDGSALSGGEVLAQRHTFIRNGSDWELQDTALGDGGILSVQEDTTPQLGGPLDTDDNSINESKGAAVASAASTDIWDDDGNTRHVTGVATITDLGTAPREGAWRKLIFDGVLILTDGANLNLPGGVDITTAANDVAFVFADTTTAFTVLYFPANGKAVVGNPLDNNFASAYDTGTQSVAVAGTFQDVDFGVNDILDGWTHVAATGVFGCNQTGNYFVDVCYSLSKTAGAAEDLQIRALIDGVEIPMSVLGATIQTSNVTQHLGRSFLVAGVAGKDLTIQFTGSSTAVQLLPGPDPGSATTVPSATITIGRVS